MQAKHFVHCTTAESRSILKTPVSLGCCPFLGCGFVAAYSLFVFALIVCFFVSSLFCEWCLVSFPDHLAVAETEIADYYTLNVLWVSVLFVSPFTLPWICLQSVIVA